MLFENTFRFVNKHRFPLCFPTKSASCSHGFLQVLEIDPSQRLVTVSPTVRRSQSGIGISRQWIAGQDILKVSNIISGKYCFFSWNHVWYGWMMFCDFVAPMVSGHQYEKCRFSYHVTTNTRNGHVTPKLGFVSGNKFMGGRRHLKYEGAIVSIPP